MQRGAASFQRLVGRYASRLSHDYSSLPKTRGGTNHSREVNNTCRHPGQLAEERIGGSAVLHQSPARMGNTWQDRWQSRSSFASSASADPGKKDGEGEEGSHQAAGSSQSSDQQGHGKSSQEEAEEKESLMGRLAETEVELQDKTEQIEKLKDTVLRSYAEMENLRNRTKREMEASRKFAVQSFAKDLLDVGDNLSRAVGAVPEQFRQGAGSAGESETNNGAAAKVLRSLVEGVLMTEQQLLKAFKKHGLEQFDPTGEPFDPNLHNALFEVPDPSKPPGTVAVVTKTGYRLHDRVIRPAEVGVVKDPAS